MISKEKLKQTIELLRFATVNSNLNGVANKKYGLIHYDSIMMSIESGELDADETETKAELTQARAEVERLKDVLKFYNIIYINTGEPK